MNLFSLARMGILGAALAMAAPLAPAAGWTPLFNGKDLSGWSSYVSWQPSDNRTTAPARVRGTNNDPKQVFSVVDGAIRVSGEEWGGLATAAEYGRFHLKFEFRWGSRKWPPRMDAPRDSGLLYFAVGARGAQSGHWMRSHEFQLKEGDCGDYHSLDGVTVDAHVGDAHQGDWQFYRYAPDLPLTRNIAARILKLGNPERPSGQWNTMEIIADGTTLIHIVNGKEVLRAYHSRQTVDGKPVALERGRFEIQSEGAEAFYRNIVIKPLDGPAAQEKF